MRIPLVVANWKMHGRLAEARVLAKGIRDGVARRRGVEVAICPPFTALAAVAETLSGSPVWLGAQNCHWEARGAFTGEVSADMLAELGCRVVILGHSERRHLFRETDNEINRKVRAALGAGLTPLLCVGETGDERRQGLTFTVVEGQLRAGWGGLAAAEIQRCALAYEPVWAIGTGVNATPGQAGEVHAYLRGLVSTLATKDIAQAMRILYGGSVKPDNAAALAAEPDIDGTLVGGASLEVRSFVAIVNSAAGSTGR
jgi:triosephosphate isomerase